MDPLQISAHLKSYHKKKGLGRGEGYTASETSIQCKICAVSMMRNVMLIKNHLNRYSRFARTFISSNNIEFNSY